MKKNYAAWVINHNDFQNCHSPEDKINFLLKYAVLAPSSHNTQPWKFHVSGNRLTIGFDPKRILYISDPNKHELLITLGCCAEIFILAALGHGYKATVKYHTSVSSNSVVTIFLGDRTKAKPKLLSSIVSRASNRNFFDITPVRRSIVENFRLSELSAKTEIVNNRDDIDYLAEATSVATVELFTPQFRAELSDWVRSNLTNKFDGMPGFAQGMPTPPSLLAKYIVKNTNISKSQAKKDSDRIRNSAFLVIIACKENTRGYIEAGRLYSRASILAKNNGLEISGVSAAMVNKSTQSEVMKKLKLTNKPVCLLRLGYTTKVARHSPRIIAPDLTD